MRLHLIAGLLATATTAACAQHTWAPGPSATGDFGVVSGQCKLMAMSGQTSGYVAASGSTRFVAAAVGTSVLVGGIASAVHQQNIYNACMEASGFVVTDGGAAPPQVPAQQMNATPPAAAVTDVAPAQPVACTKDDEKRAYLARVTGTPYQSPCS